MKGFGALVVLVLVVACAPDSTGGEEPGEESSAVSSPVEEEPTDPDAGGNGGPEPVSVELPGLPIGGVDAQFAEPSTLCVRVSWTGAPLPEGVAVHLDGFGVPPQFSVDPAPCSEAPCLGSALLTASNTGCDVAVTWAGDPVTDPESSALSATAATLTCVDQATCDAVQSNVAEVGVATIALIVPTEEDDGDGDF